MAASLFAEALFVLMVALVSALRGKDPWMVVRVPASFVLGPAALDPPGWVPHDVALGVLLHLWLAVLVGLLYAVLLPHAGVGPVAGGLVTGAVLYLAGFWILPSLFPSWLAPFWLPPAGRVLQAAAHGVYGSAFGLAYRMLASPHR